MLRIVRYFIIMNKRQQLFNDLGDCDASQDILDLINTFIDSAESNVNDVTSLLKDVTIDNMSNIKDAYEMARDVGKDLY